MKTKHPTGKVENGKKTEYPTGKVENCMKTEHARYRCHKQVCNYDNFSHITIPRCR